MIFNAIARNILRYKNVNQVCTLILIIEISLNFWLFFK